VSERSPIIQSSAQKKSPLVSSPRVQINCRTGGPVNVYLTSLGWRQMGVIWPGERVVMRPPRRVTDDSQKS
jgi:hypothetical protein